MDNAVALVDAWLRLNGYFTVTEFPVLVRDRGSFRTVTDLDVLAVRFAHAASVVPGRASAGHHGPMEMLIGEVKEGRAQLNEGASNPAVIRAALERFGCCAPEHLDEVVKQLLRTGKTTTPAGHVIRRVAFGSIPPTKRHAWETILLSEVVDGIQDFLRDNWEVVRHAQFKEPTLGLMAVLLKASAGGREE